MSARGRRSYRHPRYHRSRPDLDKICPDPENCWHGELFPGDVCECCGAEIDPLGPSDPGAEV